jgi:hypothetical protein
MSVFRATDNNNGTWTVPNQRTAYADLYDGPTERLYDSDIEAEPAADTTPRRTRRGGVVFAVVLALLALIASAAAALIAWRALAVANTRPAAAPALTPTPVAAPPAVAASAAPSAAPSAPAEDYAVSYAAEPLKVQVGCAAVTAVVPVEKGTVMCVLTSAVEAEDRGDRPRMVLVEVTDVGEDGTAGLRATSWTVPE